MTTTFASRHYITVGHMSTIFNIFEGGVPFVNDEFAK